MVNAPKYNYNIMAQADLPGSCFVLYLDNMESQLKVDIDYITEYSDLMKQSLIQDKNDLYSIHNPDDCAEGVINWIKNTFKWVYAYGELLFCKEGIIINKLDDITRDNILEGTNIFYLYVGYYFERIEIILVEGAIYVVSTFNLDNIHTIALEQTLGAGCIFK